MTTSHGDETLQRYAAAIADGVNTRYEKRYGAGTYVPTLPEQWLDVAEAVVDQILADEQEAEAGTPVESLVITGLRQKIEMLEHDREILLREIEAQSAWRHEQLRAGNPNATICAIEGLPCSVVAERLTSPTIIYNKPPPDTSWIKWEEMRNDWPWSGWRERRRERRTARIRARLEQIDTRRKS